jgi:hypothetical protein
VVVLGATGIVRASFELLHVSQLWSTSYGRTLLVKTGLLLVALALGWLLRARDSRRASVELLRRPPVAAAWCSCCFARAERAPGSGIAGAGEGPPGAACRRGARRRRARGSRLTRGRAEPRRVSVRARTCGRWLSGLTSRSMAPARGPAGTATASSAAAAGVHATAGLQADVAVPSRAPSADALVGRSGRVTALRSVTYDERLASDLTHAIETRWRFERPN